MTTPETGDSSLEDTSVQESAQTASAEDSLYDLPDDEEHQAISENEQGLESPSAPEAEPVEPPKYHVSFRRLEELNRSPVTLVAARRVESCPSMSKPLQELNDPQALITEISRHFQNDPEYIRSDMPLMEIVFRILLSRRNEYTSLNDLHYELTERWATPVRPINVTQIGLQRVLDGDTYYGFARQEDC